MPQSSCPRRRSRRSSVALETSSDALRTKLARPELASQEQILLRQRFRTAEATLWKQGERRQALARAIPEICKAQEHFLFTGKRRILVDVSLDLLSIVMNVSYLTLLDALQRVYLKHLNRVTQIDNLVGPLSSARQRQQIGYVRPDFLIPTDTPRNGDLLDALIKVFEGDRQSVLDPVLVVSTRDGERGLICQGNHRGAAAFACGKPVRVKVLKSSEELRTHLKQGYVAEYARTLTFDSFVDTCFEQAASHGFHITGWKGYLSQLQSSAQFR